ncbi:hypothetical protein HYZ99_01525 [Candidatus Peregrinibacteria bacterium]|nr:hypothetical protein [Candidatus Peregrinibacteria bacterium]
MTLKRLSRLLCTLGGVLTPATAFALQNRSLTVDLGANVKFSTVFGNAVSALAGLAGTFCGVLFLIGAFLMVISRGKDDQLQKGKDLMIQSLIGLAVVLGAYAIIRTLFAVLY